MKLRFWDRILSAVTGLAAVLAGVGIILHITGLVSLGMLEGRLMQMEQTALRAVGIITGAVLILLGIHGMGMLFRRRKDKGFVIQRTELGDMSISIKALESMAKRCVSVYPDLKVNSTHIYRSRDGISVELKVTLASGINIPLTINALQKQIKQYITSCSGIDVHEVRVKVETDIAKLAAPEQAPALEAVVPETIAAPVETVSMQLCHQEEPAPAQKAEEVPVEETQPAPEKADEQPEAELSEEAEELCAQEQDESQPSVEEEPTLEAKPDEGAEVEV